MRARKRFGQNFLVDRNYIHKIVDAVAPRENDHIIEVGPGRGALTEALVESRCSLTVVEIDRDLAAQLREQFESLDIIEADILDIDPDTLLHGQTRLVGNLPYNISTPLLFRFFPYADRIRDMHFMLQNEVVERMVASPSTSAYGRLSVMTQYYCTPMLLFRVPPAAFSPRPAVTSAIVRLEPHSGAPRASDDRVMESIVAEA
jgi:16S rRNA (adenine1518-N6/adenine1519-N6)-dimethyltransferase